ncbi:MAG: PepSY domain-containing protein, partial [bacterium]|nr:PepSY domain-containing protein [bacterium]
QKVHYLTGLIAAAWLMLMAATGVLINHQEEWGLIDVEVSNVWLPGHYTDEYRPEASPLNVVLADLHSGRFFGAQGKWIGDLAGVMLAISILTGAYCYWLRRRLN